MEKIQRDFLWGGMGEELNFHLVNQNSVCQPIQLESLGLESYWFSAKTLLGKWLWCFVVERDALWQRVIAIEYRISLIIR